MTIAAGFVVKDGILLCADTLYTDGQTKDYRDKIFPWIGKDSAVCFAIAGNATIARMVVDDCRDALDESGTKKLSIKQALAIVRPIVKNAYEQYVDTRPVDERSAADFWLLIAASAASGGFRLYSSVRSSVARVDTFECIGAGRQIGRYIIDPIYQNDMSIAQAAVLGIHAMAAAKERVDGVAGKSQFLSIRDGFVSTVVPQRIDSWEQYALDFRTAAERLLLSIGDDLNDQEFEESLGRFSEQARSIRAFWKGNPLEYMAKKFQQYLSERANPQDPQSTTADL
jgi:20S proteasome alpha/beta subunit